MTAFWILSIMLAVLPPEPCHEEGAAAKIERYTSIAYDIAEVTSSTDPIYSGDLDHKRTIFTLLSVSYHESHWSLAVDSGVQRNPTSGACGLFQANHGEDFCRRIRTDRKLAVRTALSDLRLSLGACGDLSAYASGSCLHGKKESDDMLRMTNWWIYKFKEE